MPVVNLYRIDHAVDVYSLAVGIVRLDYQLVVLVLLYKLFIDLRHGSPRFFHSVCRKYKVLPDIYLFVESRLYH